MLPPSRCRGIGPSVTVSDTQSVYDVNAPSAPTAACTSPRSHTRAFVRSRFSPSRGRSRVACICRPISRPGPCGQHRRPARSCCSSVATDIRWAAYPSALGVGPRPARVDGTALPGCAAALRLVGTGYSSHNGVPFVGKLPRGSGKVFVATGYSPPCTSRTTAERPFGQSRRRAWSPGNRVSAQTSVEVANGFGEGDVNGWQDRTGAGRARPDAAAPTSVSSSV